MYIYMLTWVIYLIAVNIFHGMYVQVYFQVGMSVRVFSILDM